MKKGAFSQQQHHTHHGRSGESRGARRGTCLACGAPAEFWCSDSVGERAFETCSAECSSHVEAQQRIASDTYAACGAPIYDIIDGDTAANDAMRLAANPVTSKLLTDTSKIPTASEMDAMKRVLKDEFSIDIGFDNIVARICVIPSEADAIAMTFDPNVRHALENLLAANVRELLNEFRTHARPETKANDLLTENLDAECVLAVSKSNRIAVHVHVYFMTQLRERAELPLATSSAVSNAVSLGPPEVIRPKADVGDSLIFALNRMFELCLFGPIRRMEGVRGSVLGAVYAWGVPARQVLKTAQLVRHMLWKNIGPSSHTMIARADSPKWMTDLGAFVRAIIGDSVREIYPIAAMPRGLSPGYTGEIYAIPTELARLNSVLSIEIATSHQTPNFCNPAVSEEERRSRDPSGFTVVLCASYGAATRILGRIRKEIFQRIAESETITAAIKNAPNVVAVSHQDKPYALGTFSGTEMDARNRHPLSLFFRPVIEAYDVRVPACTFDIVRVPYEKAPPSTTTCMEIDMEKIQSEAWDELAARFGIIREDGLTLARLLSALSGDIVVLREDDELYYVMPEYQAAALFVRVGSVVSAPGAFGTPSPAHELGCATQRSSPPPPPPRDRPAPPPRGSSQSSESSASKDSASADESDRSDESDEPSSLSMQAAAMGAPPPIPETPTESSGSAESAQKSTKEEKKKEEEKKEEKPEQAQPAPKPDDAPWSEEHVARHRIQTQDAARAKAKAEAELLEKQRQRIAELRLLVHSKNVAERRAATKELTALITQMNLRPEVDFDAIPDTMAEASESVPSSERPERRLRLVKEQSIREADAKRLKMQQICRKFGQPELPNETDLKSGKQFVDMECKECEQYTHSYAKLCSLPAALMVADKDLVPDVKPKLFYRRDSDTVPPTPEYVTEFDPRHRKAAEEKKD